MQNDCKVEGIINLRVTREIEYMENRSWAVINQSNVQISGSCMQNGVQANHVEWR